MEWPGLHQGAHVHLGLAELLDRPALKLVAVWVANHNWGEVQKKRLQREGENPELDAVGG